MSDKPTRFEDLYLLPGQPLQLDFDGYTSDRDKVTLIGYRNGLGIIATTPMANGSAMALKLGTELTVRLFAPKLSCACAFRTVVLHVSRAPYPHIHLSMPESLVLGAVRSSVRARVDLDVQVKYGDKQHCSAIIQDLSLGGARLVAKMLPVVAGDRIGITANLDIGDIKRSLELSGIVKTLGQAQTGITVGIQFSDMSDIDKITLHAYVLSNIHG